MKSPIFMFLLALMANVSSAQDTLTNATFELRGTVSFKYGYSSAASNYLGQPMYEKEQNITLEPACGYFITREIEVLVDLNYSFQLRDQSLSNLPSQSYSHALGFGLGAAYNYQVNPYFSAFVGTRIGASWTRLILSSNPNVYPGYDSDWGRRTLEFPDFFVGGRFFFSKDWSLTLIAEYKKMDYSKVWVPWDKSESLFLGFGFSVFLK